MDDYHFSNVIVRSFSSLLLILCLITLCFSSATAVSTINNCSSTEIQALISLKQSLKDPSSRLSSWGVDLNCCHWHGITCDFITGKVTKIDLRNSLGFNHLLSYYADHVWADGAVGLQEYANSCLGGQINHSILQLKYLNYLDLSLNNFEGAPIPYFFGMLKNLRYLNLSSAYFGGEIPPHLGNLSKLNYLDLSTSNPAFYEGTRNLRAESLHWLSGLSSLKYLNIEKVNMSSVGTDWMHTVNMLSSLAELHLIYCAMSFDTSTPLTNLTLLKVLDLSGNSINSSMPLWLSNLTGLTKLDLSSNYIQGTIPTIFWKMKNLQYLDLSYNRIGIGGHVPSFLRNLCRLRFLNLAENKFVKLDEFLGSFSNCSYNSLESLDLSNNKLVGEIPNSLGTLKKLRKLDLSYNDLNGSLPNLIGNLSLLQYLYISGNLLNGTIPPSFGQLSELYFFYSLQNSWEAVITEAQLVNLRKLEILAIGTSENQSLVFNVPYDWIPPFKLKYLSLTNCIIGPQFPVWLQVQTQLVYVVLSGAGITGTIPKDWLSNMSSQITYLDLSNNLLNGTLSYMLASHSHEVNFIDPSRNLLEDSLMKRYNKLTILNLENNLLSGPIPSNIGDLIPNLMELRLSENHLNDTIPSSIQKMSGLHVLSLSNNQLSGELPDGWGASESLYVIDLANNNLYGEIPSSIGLLATLDKLILSNNHFCGEIPKSLQNCALKSIDISKNRLHGNLPSWIGVTSSELLLINLRSNFFNGTIPRQWCNLLRLRVLDLSNNNLSGEIPNCLYNWTSFVYNNYGWDLDSYDINSQYNQEQYSYTEKTMLVMKGNELEYDTILQYVLTIDLSCNKLSGEIPNEITILTYLVSLNLSGNSLVGSIPENIGDMQRLETLDLSRNHFSGRIPSSLSSLTFLAHLNLSFNNLTGRVPTSIQLQTLEPSIYEGNPSLCGSPLQIRCPGDENANNNTLPILKREEQAKENSSLMFGFYMSMAIGFPVGLNILFFTILLKKSWRASYFGFIDRVNYNILDIFVLIEICIRRRIRR